MEGYYTYPNHAEPLAQAAATRREQGAPAAVARDATAALAPDAPERRKRVAIVTQGVKLPGEERGYTRFRFIAELAAREGFDVELITSSFQHWDKRQRVTERPCYQGLPYRITFVYEPGYKRNIDPLRIHSHHVLARNLKTMLEQRFSEDPHAFDLIYSEIPPNDMALACAQVAQAHDIPYVCDVNDLWPEAMRMALDVPIVSDIAFSGFARDARKTYQLIAAAVGTSEEYASRPAADRALPYEKVVVYVGNNLATFDEGAAARAAEVEKPEGELWVIYTGTLGASYDIATLIEAAKIAAATDEHIRVKILGDGPDRESLETLAAREQAPVDFVGYAPYDLMAAYLRASDITVNSLIKSAPQSIVTKIGDYLAAGIPLINTGSSPEFRAKVEADGFGVNVEAEDPEALAQVILNLASHPDECAVMGARAREIAEQQFDQPHSYLAITDLFARLTS